MEEIVKPDGSFNQTIDPRDGLIKCTKLGLINGVEFYYNKINDQFVKYTIMELAAFFGHRDIVELMITKGANHWNGAIIEAARGGQKDMIVFLLAKRGKTKRRAREKNRAALNLAMYHALYNGHIDVANFLIARGASDWNEAMVSAARTGRIDIVNFLIAKGANNWNWDGVMAFAAGSGHIDIVELMITKGAINWNWTMGRAAVNGHIDIVKLMVEKGANDWNSAMHTRHLDIIAFLKQKLQPTLVDYVGSETCSICYVQDTLSMCITKCNHAFHRDCINLWVQEHISCPMCRNNL